MGNSKNIIKRLEGSGQWRIVGGAIDLTSSDEHLNMLEDTADELNELTDALEVVNRTFAAQYRAVNDMLQKLEEADDAIE